MLHKQPKDYSSLYFWACTSPHYKLEEPFTIADSAYGSTFFVATGFHGLHIVIGTTFLTTCLLRHTTLHFSSNHHFGFEAAA
jgi:cytochrome c oxidase subunit 3